MILYLKMIGVKSHITWVILRMKHPRIWMPPTQFQKLSKNFKIEFPGRWTKIFISPESAWFTELFSDFQNIKIGHKKKLYRFLFPEFNLSIHSCITSIKIAYYNILLVTNCTLWYKLTEQSRIDQTNPRICILASRLFETIFFYS